MKQIIVAILLVLILSGMCYAQPSQLTDRELLIQLYTKVESIEKGIYNLNTGFENNKRDIYSLDRRVTTYETNFAGFCERFDDLTIRWNTLIAIFFASLLGMIAWTVRRTNGNGRTNHKTN